MNPRLRRLADRLGSSYWFLPTVMACLAVLLAGAMIWLDSRIGTAWMDDVSFLHAARPSGARQVLSTIGGSMIGVAGTVFSVTIAAVVYASGQYGPRLLTNFMKDRGNQVTLGTFIATFLYCLLVLRTIRSADEGGSDFVPNIAVLVGVGLALCSIGVLIFFIHHIPSTIHINSVIKGIGDRLLAEIDNRFPRFVGAEVAEGVREPAVPTTFRPAATAAEAGARRQVAATATGYIQLIDDTALLSVAERHGLVLRLQYQPGDFVHAGRTMVEAWPPGSCDDKAVQAIGRAFVVGSSRTPLQDLRFLIDELVEIAARALSPGVNDPFTAVTCLDWLGAALSALAACRLPSHLRVDAAGELRVIAHPVTFASLLDRSFGTLAQYCAGDMVAALRFVEALGEISLGCTAPDRLAALADSADDLLVLVETSLTGFNRERVRTRVGELRRALAEPDYQRCLREGTAWLGGTA